MDWKLAIRKNREALALVVAGLAAMLAPETARLPRPACHAIRRILRPAESALRRLIVIVAAMLKVQKRNGGGGRPLPDFKAFNRGEAIPAFPLIDPRKTFVPDTRWDGPDGEGQTLPRISVPGFSDPGFFTKPEEMIDAALIQRRIAALDHALKTLPRQARRLARMMERRSNARPGLGRVGPLRPGLPPGHRTRHRHPVDAILNECHGLARDLAFQPP